MINADLTVKEKFKRCHDYVCYELRQARKKAGILLLITAGLGFGAYQSQVHLTDLDKQISASTDKCTAELLTKDRENQALLRTALASGFAFFVMGTFVMGGAVRDCVRKRNHFEIEYPEFKLDR